MIRLDRIDIDHYKRMVAVRFLPGLIILVLSFYWVAAFGEEIPTAQPPVPKNVKPANGATTAKEGYVDRSQAYVDRKINEVVTWVDDLFGPTAGGETAKAENTLQWSNQLRAEKGKSIKFRSSLNAHLHLPKFEKRIRLVIIDENREEAVAPVPIDPGTPVANTPTNSNTLRAVNTELRYYARDTKAGYVFLAVGSRFVWLPETFVRARFLWRHLLADNNTFISPSVTPFWQDHIGFGVTPQLDFGHTFVHNNIFLWANSATFFKNRSGFLWGTEVSVSRVLSPASAIAFAVGAHGATRPSTVSDRFNLAANNYKAAVKYRRNIYRPWLFLELIPETNWQRREAAKREIVPAFTVRLEINSAGPRALLPVPLIVKEQLPVPEYGDY